MTTMKIALAASLGLALARPALAADADTSGTTTTAQEQEQVRARVHHVITHQGDVSEQDAKDVDAEVSDHAKHAGYGPAISQAIQDALAAGCKGQCLVEKIHAINHAAGQGSTAAGAAATSKGTTSKGARDPSTDAQARSMDHRRDGAQREAAADRVHDRTMDRGQAGSHAVGGGMGHH